MVIKFLASIRLLSTLYRHCEWSGIIFLNAIRFDKRKIAKADSKQPIPLGHIATRPFHLVVRIVRAKLQIQSQ